VCVCRWGPVALAVGHDLTYLLWNSSHLGSKALLTEPSFFLQICLYAIFHGCLRLFFTTIMLICYYLPWVPMRGGAHVLLLPRMPYGEGAARVPMRFYAT